MGAPSAQTKPTSTSRATTYAVGVIVAVGVAGFLYSQSVPRPSAPLRGAFYGTWTDGDGRSGVVAMEIQPDGSMRANLDSEGLKDVVLVSGRVGEDGSATAEYRFSRGARSLGFPGRLMPSSNGRRVEGSFVAQTQARLAFAMSLERTAEYRQFPSHPLVASTPAAAATAPSASIQPAATACPDCQGSGTVERMVEVTVACSYCNGRGARQVLDPVDGIKTHHYVSEPCFACSGLGTAKKMESRPYQCPRCHGTGRV